MEMLTYWTSLNLSCCSLAANPAHEFDLKKTRHRSFLTGVFFRCICLSLVVEHDQGSAEILAEKPANLLEQNSIRKSNSVLQR